MQIDFSFIAKNKVTLPTQISDFRSAIKVVRKKATKTHKRTSAIRISCENPELTKCSREYHRQSEAVSAYLVGLVYRFLMALDGVHPTNFSECCYFADYSAYGSIFLFTDPVPDLSWRSVWSSVLLPSLLVDQFPYNLNLLPIKLRWELEQNLSRWGKIED